MKHFPGIITQARMGSTRLRGKVLLTALGKPLLQHHIERLQKSNLPVVIATTLNSEDDPIETLGREWNIPVFRGDEQDVLKRFYDCAQHYNFDPVVRITSDCPLIDGYWIAQMVKTYTEKNNDNLYLSNCRIRTYPRGFDTEVFSFKLMENAHVNATDPGDREHVTPYIVNNKPGNVIFCDITDSANRSHFRLTVDVMEDFKLIKELIEKYKAHGLRAEEITKILMEHPDLPAINAKVEQKKI